MKKIIQKFTHSLILFSALATTSNLNAQAPFMVKDISPGAPASSPNNLVNFNGTLFFCSDDGVHGNELWKSDGTSSGTVMITDLNPNGPGSNPGNFCVVNNTLFFIANFSVGNNPNKNQLWKTDGTVAGTVFVKDSVIEDISTPQTYAFTSVNNTLFFKAYDAMHGVELWKSDGTTSGTVLVKDIHAGTADGGIENLINLNNTLVFGADSGLGYNYRQLWKTDGTAVGTVVIPAASGQPYAPYSVDFLKNMNGSLYFQARDGVNGYELWKSDGTQSGTVMVKDISAGSGDSNPVGFTFANNTIYFAADDANGTELWKSDGTAAGTVMVKDIHSGSAGSSPTGGYLLTNVNGTLFFYATDGTAGQELWKSDGTAAGTVLVKNLGSASLTIDRLTAANSTLIFRANDGVNGRELWESDGTAAGTILRDINPSNSGGFPGSSSPDELTNINGTVFFQAGDGTHGTELWAVTATPNDIHDFSNGNLSVYPNPNNGIFTLELEKTTINAAIQITNVLGEIIYDRAISGSNSIIDLRDITPGLYTIRVTEENKISSSKFIKQ